MGRPKALVVVDGEPLVRRGWRALRDAGLTPRIVVVGAEHEAAAAAVPVDADTEVVVADGWAEGMGASLRAGLAALGSRTPEATPDAVLVALVDTPGIGADALRRVAEQGPAGRGAAALARGACGGVPGHPVLLGHEHWDAVTAGARGDRGARDHLRGHPDLTLVEIGDLADPTDVDTPEDLDHLTGRPDRRARPDGR